MTKMLLASLAFGALMLGATSAIAGPYRYDARAQALFVKDDSGPVLGLGVVDTMPRFKDGEQTDRGVGANLAGILQASAFRAHCETFEGKVRSTAKVEGLHLVPNALPILPDLISATSVSSVTIDTAKGTPHGFAEFTDLMVLGVPVNVTGEPNQKLTVNLAGLGKVQIAFNVQTTFADGHMNNVALRVTLPTGVLIEIAKSVAGSTPKDINP